MAMLTQTTLRNNGAFLPSDAEITEMVQDPVDWMDNYKVGQPFRLTQYTGDTANWQLDANQAARTCKVWAMGDGAQNAALEPSSLAYALGSGQNSVMYNMNAGDIVNVTIPGLS